MFRWRSRPWPNAAETSKEARRQSMYAKDRRTRCETLPPALLPRVLVTAMRASNASLVPMNMDGNRFDDNLKVVQGCTYELDGWTVRDLMQTSPGLVENLDLNHFMHFMEMPTWSKFLISRNSGRKNRCPLFLELLYPGCSMKMRNVLRAEAQRNRKDDRCTPYAFGRTGIGRCPARHGKRLLIENGMTRAL